MEQEQNVLEESISENVDQNAEGEQVESVEAVEEVESQAPVFEDDPISVKKRLGMQARKHSREMKAMNERLSQMQQSMGGNGDASNSNQQAQPDYESMSEPDRIKYAVNMALGMQDEQKKQAEDAKQAQHVQKQYQRLSGEFDKASDKYEDFDDVVRGDETPFTANIRDALLLVENPAEVAYKLGKNRTELERISKLHPLDQAREVNKLSFSLMGSGLGKPTPSRTTPMDGLKGKTGGSSQAVTGKTSPSEIRARMKAGSWK